MNDVTRLLGEMASGDLKAGEQLIASVYADLRRMAAYHMAGQGDRSLQPTALVHEAWLRLGGDHMGSWRNRAHFFASAATAMRSILIDHARRRKAIRHGGGQEHLPLDNLEVADTANADDQILAIHDVLDQLAAEQPAKAELVKLRYFVGLSMKEAADVLGVSEATAHRWWAYARAWLAREIKLRN